MKHAYSDSMLQNIQYLRCTEFSVDCCFVHGNLFVLKSNMVKLFFLLAIPVPRLFASRQCYV